MAIVINGSGTVTGLAVGGLPDGTVDAGTVAADVATQAEIDLKPNIISFASTGIDDNATSTAATLSDTGLHLTGNFRQAELVITTKSIDLTTTLQDLIQVGNRASYKITVSVGDGSTGTRYGHTVAFVSCSNDYARHGNINYENGTTLILSWKAANGTSADAHTLQARTSDGTSNQNTIMVETLSRYASAGSGTSNGQSSILL